MLDAAHRKSPELSIAPKKEDIVESIIFKASDVVVVTFKDVDLNFARKGTEDVCDDIILCRYINSSPDIPEACTMKQYYYLVW